MSHDMNASTHSSSAVTFQHSPYAYSALPEAYRTGVDHGQDNALPTYDEAHAPPMYDPSVASWQGNHSLSTFAPHVSHLGADSSSEGMYYRQRHSGTTSDVQCEPPRYHGYPSYFTNEEYSQDGGNNLGDNVSIRVGGTNVYPQQFSNRRSGQPARNSTTNVQSILAARRGMQHYAAHLGVSPNATPRPEESSAPSTPLQRAQTTGQPFVSNHTQNVDPNAKFHTPLEGVCDYVPLPQDELTTPEHWPAHRTVDGTGITYRAFVGQVRFETTAEQVAWMIEQATGVVACYVAYHRVGCFVVHFSTPEDCYATVSYHKRVLCDLNGIWIAHDDSQLNSMNDEINNSTSTARRAKFRRCRIPRGGMVIEVFTDSDAGTPMRQGPTGLMMYSQGEMMES